MISLYPMCTYLVNKRIIYLYSSNTSYNSASTGKNSNESLQLSLFAVSDLSKYSPFWPQRYRWIMRNLLSNNLNVFN